MTEFKGSWYGTCPFCGNHFAIYRDSYFKCDECKREKVQ